MSLKVKNLTCESSPRTSSEVAQHLSLLFGQTVSSENIFSATKGVGRGNVMFLLSVRMLELCNI